MKNATVIDGLLRSEDPSIRWKTRVHVLGEGSGSKQVRALREEIRGSPRVRALLSRQTQLGRTGTARHVYYKWQGAHWVLAALADIGYPTGIRPCTPCATGCWSSGSARASSASSRRGRRLRRTAAPVFL